MDSGVTLPGGTPLVAVTFDFWNTLVCTRSSGTRAARRAALGAELSALGHPVTPDELDAALDSAVAVFEEHWRANRQFGALDGAAVAIESLGVRLDAHQRRRLVAAFVDAAAGLAPELTPGASDVLGALRSAGVRIGIICDVGLTPSVVLRDYLARRGVLNLFDHWSFSDEVGTYKPDPVIFGHALTGLGGVDPRSAVHVGDLRRTDVAGARGAGMHSVRYTGRHDDPLPGEEADAVVTHLAELVTLLGVAANTSDPDTGIRWWSGPASIR